MRSGRAHRRAVAKVVSGVVVVAVVAILCISLWLRSQFVRAIEARFELDEVASTATAADGRTYTLFESGSVPGDGWTDWHVLRSTQGAPVASPLSNLDADDEPWRGARVLHTVSAKGYPRDDVGHTLRLLERRWVLLEHGADLLGAYDTRTEAVWHNLCRPDLVPTDGEGGRDRWFESARREFLAQVLAGDSTPTATGPDTCCSIVEVAGHAPCAARDP